MVKRTPLEERVLSRIRPTNEEREYICSVARQLLTAISAAGQAQGMVVGSIARSTWISGEHDIDIFLLFSPTLSCEMLEQQGMALARRIAAQFTDRYFEKYAEHPYIYASIDGVGVDLVPCYAVETATNIQSAVDRTPFHTRYITNKINGLIDDVLLLKQFLKAGRIYGSDQMTEGFSGYLCELLILNYGGFTPLLEAASVWRPGAVIDIEHHAAKKFIEPLIVVDPVDPRRNVAAAVSLNRMVEFIELCRGYLDNPEESFFAVPTHQAITRAALAKLIKERRTHLFAITFATPPYIPEIVIPQLKRSTTAVCELLDRHGFAVYHASFDMQPEQCMLMFELLFAELPAVRQHLGPPLWNRVNAGKFFEKYAAGQPLAPYIKNGRYEVEVPREYTHAKTLLESSHLENTSLGKHVKKAIGKGWTVDEGVACWRKEFAAFIAGFFDRCSPLARIRRK